MLGPGLVTGAADDDPSGIATYSQGGAQFGYALGWTMFLTTPFMIAIQLVSARIGAVTGQGLAANLGKAMPRGVLHGLVGLLLIANTLNIAADIAAMGDALRLVVGGPLLVYIALFGIGCLAAEILIPYHSYSGYLKTLTLVLFAYVATAFTIRIPWGRGAGRDLRPAPVVGPRLHADAGGDLRHHDQPVYVLLAGLARSRRTQAAQQSVDSGGRRRSPQASGAAKSPFASGSTPPPAWCCRISSAFSSSSPPAPRCTPMASRRSTPRQQAAEALRPLAGPLAFVLFSLGIIGTGLLAVPVLAGSAGYAVAESFGWEGSLELPARGAPGFYLIVAAATLAGLGAALTPLDPIRMLFWSAVVNGVVAVPLMVAHDGGRRQPQDHGQIRRFARADDRRLGRRRR